MKRLSKPFKILLINILFIALLLISTEILLIKKDNNFRSLNDYYNNLIKHKLNTSNLKKGYNEYSFRQVAGLEESKKGKPIIIVGGCSFTYGDLLKEEEAFHSILSNHTKKQLIILE